MQQCTGRPPSLIELSECKNRHQSGFMSDLPLSMRPASQRGREGGGRAGRQTGKQAGSLWERQAQYVCTHVSPCAKSWNVCLFVRTSTSRRPLRMCAIVCAVRLQSTLISVSEESVIEHKHFRQRAKTVTRCSNTRGDKKKKRQKSYFVLSLFSVLFFLSTLAHLCFLLLLFNSLSFFIFTFPS